MNTLALVAGIAMLGGFTFLGLWILARDSSWSDVLVSVGITAITVAVVGISFALIGYGVSGA